MSLFLRLVSASVVAANQASHIIRNVMQRGNLAIIDKGIDDPQTEADRSAQKCILNLLSSQFPSATFIGEEDLSKYTPSSSSYLTDSQRNEDISSIFQPTQELTERARELYDDLKEEDTVIWIDPLDGTSEYTAGYLDRVTVLIGIASKGIPIAGIMSQPFYENPNGTSQPKGRTFWGSPGLGVHGISHRKPISDNISVATTRTHYTSTIEKAIEAFSPHQIIRAGGAGYKILLLIEGQAQYYVYPSKGCSKWDTCAPQALLVACGGKLTDIFGKEYTYDKDVSRVNATGVLATYDQKLHDSAVAKIPETVLSTVAEQAQTSKH